MILQRTLNISQSQSLLAVAETYLAMGWSVIPTFGKVAAVPWRSFQNQPPSPEQLAQWFAEDDYPGIAIITGPVSRLAVLDFDDPILYLSFVCQYPSLSETYTVQTRRGFHLYYHIPPQLRLTSRSVPGVDFQYNGKYVVAPPSVAAGYTYTAIRDVLPKTLSENDTASLTRFLDRCQNPGVESLATPLPGTEPPKRKNRAANRLSTPEERQFRRGLLPSDLAALYRNVTLANGRNNTLFKLARLGRDNGLTQDQVIKALADLHADREPSGDHRRETRTQRYREATRTIESAFSRPARAGRHRYPEPDQLPNPVREALLQRGLTCGVRVIEALRLHGVQPGQAVTKKQAVGLLTGVVGRDSVYSALNAVIDGEKLLFARVKNPLPRSPSPTVYGVAKTTVPKQNPKCLEFELPKPGKIPARGCPPEHFVMPSNVELAEKLAVKRSTISDELTAEDLKSAKTTRTACHAGLIKRKPGQYSIRFFAHRLGMSERTIYRYNAADNNIHSEPVYFDQPVFWNNLEAIIPPDPGYFPHEGVFLVALDQKYPPNRPIARKLLAKKQLVILRTRLANYWWYGDKDAPMPVRLQADLQAILEKMEQKAARRGRYFGKSHTQHPAGAPGTTPGQTPPANNPTSRLHLGGTQAAKTGVDVDIKRPLKNPNDEAFAKYVYRTINTMSERREGQISLSSARRLVVKYGETAIRHALEITAKRRNVRKPVGFISTLLRLR